MNNRNSGVDIARILAMVFIITHHVVVNDFQLQHFIREDKVIEWWTNSRPEILILCLANSAVVIGVNLFFLLSGYCGIHFKWRRIVSIVFFTYFVYSIIVLIGIKTNNLVMDEKQISYLIKPMDRYWFIITYLFLYITSPLLNMIIEKISLKEFKHMLIWFFVIFCGYGFLMDTNLHINRGYSYLFSLALYLIGGGMKKYRSELSTRMTKKALTIIFVMNTVLNTVIISLLILRNRKPDAWRLYSYNNPILVINSLIIILYCTRYIRINSNRILALYAQATMMTYMIHSSCWLTRYRTLPIRSIGSNYGFAVAVLWTPVEVIIIFTIGCILDRIYSMSIGSLLNKVLDKIEFKITGNQ